MILAGHLEGPLDSRVSGTRQWPLHPVVNYKYFSFLLLILGISQAWLLLPLEVAHSKDMKLEIFWSTELTVGFLTARTWRTYYFFFYCQQLALKHPQPRSSSLMSIHSLVTLDILNHVWLLHSHFHPITRDTTYVPPLIRPTFLHTAWSRVLLEKLTISQLVEKLKYNTKNTDEYNINKNNEACVIQFNSTYNKICILTIYRSPMGNFTNFLNWLDFILQKLYKRKYIICGDVNVNYLNDNNRKCQLDAVLHSYNLAGIVKFPTRTGLIPTLPLTVFSLIHPPLENMIYTLLQLDSQIIMSSY